MRKPTGSTGTRTSTSASAVKPALATSPNCPTGNAGPASTPKLNGLMPGTSGSWARAGAAARVAARPAIRAHVAPAR